MISVVIPTFNRRAALSQLLDDLICQEAITAEIIVVDDNSTDGTAEMVLSRYPSIIYLRNAVNRGPTVSRNRGIRQARGDIMLGLDSDVTVPDRRMLARMETLFSQMPPMRAVALRVFESDGRRDDAPRWWHPAPMAHYADRRFETSYFSGTAFAFRTGEILKVGAFPEAIFQYFEEIEVAFRFMDAGGSIIYIPELSVRHHPGSRALRWSDHRMFHHPRTLVLLTLACYPVLRGTYFLLPRLANAFLTAALSNRLPVFFRALYSAIQAAPGRLRERKPLRPSTWRRIAELRRTPRLITPGGPPDGGAILSTHPALERFNAVRSRRSISLKPSTP